MSATSNLLDFPVQHSCPTCNRVCSEEDLSECLRCGQQYCSKDSWECACDREADEILERALRGMNPVQRMLTMLGLLIERGKRGVLAC